MESVHADCSMFWCYAAILEPVTAAETQNNAAFIANLPHPQPPCGPVLLLQLQEELLSFLGLDQWL